MTLAEAIFFASAGAAVISLLFYARDVINEKIHRYTRWSELTHAQAWYALGILQFPLLVVLLLCWRLV